MPSDAQEAGVVVVPGYGFITPEGVLVNAGQMLYAYPASDPTATHGARLFFPVANVNPGEDCRSELDTKATVQEIAAALAPKVTEEEVCEEMIVRARRGFHYLMNRTSPDTDPDTRAAAIHALNNLFDALRGVR